MTGLAPRGSEGGQVATTVQARTAGMALVAGTLILTVGLALPGTGRAATTFEGVAAADGIRVGLRAPNAPVTDTPVDSGGPTAQALLNSSGTSRAFASHPYPGEAVVTGPGTVAGFTGGQVSPPAYPFAVSSDYPTVPHQATAQGPYTIEATSAERRSESRARVGADAGPVVLAHASVLLDDAGGAVAAAESDVSALAAGDVRFGRVLSTARVARAADGTLTRSSDLQVTGFTVAGTAVAIGPAGLTLPGSTVPLPASDPVRQALDQAGVTVTYLAAQPQPTGVVAPGLAVSAPVQIPGGGTATVTYTVGRASAAVAGVPVPGGEVVGGTVPADGGTPSGSAPDGVGPGGGSGTGAGSATGSSSDGLGTGGNGRATGAFGRGGANGASTAGSAGGGANGATSAGSADAATTAGGADAVRPGSATPGGDGGSGSQTPGAGTALGVTPAVSARGFDSAGIFLVLAGAGLVAFALVSLFSALGVRSR
jgi:hypothetical protein